MPTVFDTAKYILETRGRMSTMKLQKLCYYCQAWSLVWDDEELFPEEFEAWANGPVCRKLYNAAKGMFSVSANNFPGNSNHLSNNQKDTINHVLAHYAPHNAQWLSQLTHMEDPWQVARKGVQPGVSSSNIISKLSMSDYYGGFVRINV